jgi:predicted nucleic acid-binding protein
VILLDTSVLSELMRREPDARVVAWLDAQPAESVWTTAITVFEIRTGIDLLDAGRRRRELDAAFARLLADDLEGRVQNFDQRAALAAGAIAARRQTAGRTVEIRDTLIAGIVLARRATLATANTRHFDDLQVELVNPWIA